VIWLISIISVFRNIRSPYTPTLRTGATTAQIQIKGPMKDDTDIASLEVLPLVFNSNAFSLFHATELSVVSHLVSRR
jgi:hypothetical protein